MASTSQEVAMAIDSEAATYIKPRTMHMDKEVLNLLIELAVDFGSLEINGCDIRPFLKYQHLNNYFEMLNGPSYTKLVKYLWVRAEVYDQEAAHREEYEKILQNRSLEGNTREQIGLTKFTSVEIRSVVMGVKVTITEAMISKITGCRDNGMFFTDTNKTIKTSEWGPKIHKALFEGRQTEKCVHLRKEHMIHQKLIIMCFMPWEGGTNYMSWDHKYFLCFLVKQFPINLPACIFDYMCNSIREGIKGKKTLPYTRLLSEIIHQKLEDLGIASDKDLGTCTGNVTNGTMHGHKRII